MFNWLTAWVSRGPFIATACGHVAPRVSKIIIGGQELTRQITKAPEYCADCCAKMAIFCYRCGGIIMPNDPIILPPVAPPENAVVHDGRPVGCQDCGEMFCDVVARWVAPGKVEMPPYEELVDINPL